MSTIDADVVRHALQVARENGFAEVEILHGDASFRATFEPNAKKKAEPSPAPETSDAPAMESIMPILSRHVGYFRSDGGKLSVGQVVAKGDSVASISSLGLSNDVEASIGGEIIEVLVQDGEPVEFGQALAMVKT